MAVDPYMYHLEKGWIVEYEDGTVIPQFDNDGVETRWLRVPKRGIKSLTLKWHNKHWTITGKSIYIQFCRAWISPGMSEHVVKERCIGYWDGPNKVVYRVDEATGNMKMTVED